MFASGIGALRSVRWSQDSFTKLGETKYWYNSIVSIEVKIKQKYAQRGQNKAEILVTYLLRRTLLRRTYEILRRT